MRIPGTARRGLTGASETQAFRTAALARHADADSTSSTARRRNAASAAVRSACCAKRLLTVKPRKTLLLRCNADFGWMSAKRRRQRGAREFRTIVGLAQMRGH